MREGITRRDQHRVQKDRKPSSWYLRKCTRLCKVGWVVSKPWMMSRTTLWKSWCWGGVLKIKNHHPLY